MVYLVSYDLVREGATENDYPALFQRLKNDGAIRVLWSEWLVESPGSAKDVADRYWAVMDANDRIFVTEVTNNSAYKNLLSESQAESRFFPKLRRVA